MMIFPDGFANYLKRRGFKFRVSNIESIPSNASGVYVFFYKSRYLYVGKSGSNQGIRERLYTHLNDTHNPGLRREHNCLKSTMMISWIPCEDFDLDDLEKSLIRHLQPAHNEVRYLDY